MSNLKPTCPFPTTISELQAELLVHSKDGRSDPGFRLNIALSQMGSLAAHFTHDPVENPIARPYGTKASEISDAGHAMLQLMTYCALRGINLQEAINSALGNLRDKDFIKRESTSDASVIKGHCALLKSDNMASNPLLVWSPGAPVGGRIPMPPDDPKKYALVVSHAVSDARLSKFGAIITDHGGNHCHAAIIAREYGIPCVFGTGDATKKLAGVTEVKIEGDRVIPVNT